MEGRIDLICAVLLLSAIAIVRLVRSGRSRYVVAAMTATVGLCSALVATAFIANGVNRAQVIVAVGVPRDLWVKFGVFRDLRGGPFLAVAGGLLCIVSAALTILWSAQLADPQLSTSQEVSPRAASG